jgi:hypothetical protein
MTNHFHVCVEGKLRDGRTKWCDHCDKGKLAHRGLPPHRVYPRLTMQEALLRLGICECGTPLTEDNVYWKCDKCAAAWLRRGAQMDRGRRNRSGYRLGEEDDDE